jgi:hypothetical protein
MTCEGIHTTRFSKESCHTALVLVQLQAEHRKSTDYEPMVDGLTDEVIAVNVDT